MVITCCARFFSETKFRLFPIGHRRWGRLQISYFGGTCNSFEIIWPTKAALYKEEGHHADWKKVERFFYTIITPMDKGALMYY